MLYRDFGKTGWQVSVVDMGTWNIGNQWGELDDATAWATTPGLNNQAAPPDFQADPDGDAWQQILEM